MVIKDRAVANLPKEEAHQLLHQMMLIRRFEEKAAEMYARGRIKGFLHLYIGEEAVGVGVISRLEPQDYIYTHYREHGHAIARGVDTKAIMAELFGKATGISRGLGGSMHIFDVPRRFMGGYAIVGGHMPLACGTAMSNQRLEPNAATVCIIGDGSVNEGAFHESLNLAAIWKLPVLFLLENNGYGMGTPITKVSATPDIYKHAEVYGIRAKRIDGNDLMAVREATDEALAHIRAGEGPYFLECLTYRFRGHSMADPELYRQKSEVEEARRTDPIQMFADSIREAGLLTDEELAGITQSIETEIQEAADFAEESPFPELSTIMDNMYAPSPLDNLAKQQENAPHA